MLILLLVISIYLYSNMLNLIYYISLHHPLTLITDVQVFLIFSTDEDRIEKNGEQILGYPCSKICNLAVQVYAIKRLILKCFFFCCLNSDPKKSNFAS